MLLPSQISQMQIDEVVVNVKASLRQIDLVAAKIGPFAAGTEAKMERWQAEVLSHWGIVEMSTDSRSLLLKAYGLRDKEQTTRSLEEMEDIFQVFPEIVRRLQAEGQLGQKIGAVKALHEDLLTSRTNKITRVARMGQDPGDKLSPEESWLYHSLSRIFSLWRTEAERLLDPGKEKGDVP